MFQTRIVQWADGVMTRFDEMALFTVKVMRPAVRPSANGTVVPVDGGWRLDLLTVGTGRSVCATRKYGAGQE